MNARLVFVLVFALLTRACAPAYCQRDLKIDASGNPLPATPLNLGGPNVVGSPASLTGNQLWVDAANGSNTTALRGRFDKPYATLTAAKAAAVSGDTIRVRSGTYAITDSILKNGVTWLVDSGAVVNYTNSASDYGPLDDKGVALTCSVSGDGVFNRTETTAGSMNTPRVAATSNPASRVEITCRSLNFASAATSSYGAWAFDGYLSVRANTILCNGGGTNIPVAWSNGNQIVQAFQIVALGGSGSYGVYTACSATPTGDLWVDADSIDLSATPAGITALGVNNAGTDPTAAAWIRVGTVKINGVTTSRAARMESGSGANKVYITAQKLFGPLENSGSGLLYVQTQKWSSVANYGVGVQGAFLRAASGDTRVTAEHCDPGAFTTAGGGAFNVGGGTVSLNGIDYLANTGSGGLIVSGGTVWLRNSRLDLSANPVRSAVTISGGAAYLQASRLKSYSAKYDVEQTAGTASIIGGQGTNANGSFVTSGAVQISTTSPPLTGFRYGNGSGADTAATGAQGAALIAGQDIAPNSITTNVITSPSGMNLSIGGYGSSAIVLGSAVIAPFAGFPNLFTPSTPGGMAYLSGVSSVGPYLQPGLVKTAAYTIAATDGDIEANATSGAFTLTYHTLSGNAGLIRNISNVGSANNVTVSLPAGTTFVNGSGAGTATMAVTPGSSVQLKINAAGNKVIVL